MAAIGIFSQENFDPVSATSSGDRMSTKINPRPKVSFTSVTLIFAASASADAETLREDLLADDFGLVVFLNDEELLVENSDEDDWMEVDAKLIFKRTFDACLSVDVWLCEIKCEEILAAGKKDSLY